MRAAARIASAPSARCQLPTLHDELLVERHAGCSERLAVAGAGAGRPSRSPRPRARRRRRCAVRPSEIRYSVAARAPCDVLHRHVVGRSVEDALTEQHERRRDVEQVRRPPARGRATLNRMPSTIRIRGPCSTSSSRSRSPPLCSIITTRSCFAAARMTASASSAKYALLQVGDDEADRAGAARAQAARRQVRLIAESGDRVEDPRAGLLAGCADSR